MADRDRWPNAEGERYAMIVALDRRARQWIRVRISNSVNRQEIVDQATLYLLARVLAAEPPDKPWAWLRTVISRSCGTAEGGRITGMGEWNVLSSTEELQAEAISNDDPEEVSAERSRAWLDENLEMVLADAPLTPYQEAVVRNVLVHRDFEMAAKSLGKETRHVRVAWRRALAKFSSRNPPETPRRRG